MSSPVAWSFIGIGAFHLISMLMGHVYAWCSTRRHPCVYIEIDDETCPVCGAELNGGSSPLDEIRDALDVSGPESEPEIPVEETTEFEGYKS
jgi:hypothetical protein